MAVCTKCRASLAPDARRCPRCGEVQAQAGEFDTIMPPKRPGFGAGSQEPDSGLARPPKPERRDQVPPAPAERPPAARSAKPRQRSSPPAQPREGPRGATPPQSPPGQAPPQGYWGPPPQGQPAGYYPGGPYPYPPYHAPPGYAQPPQPPAPPPAQGKENVGLFGRIRGLIGGEAAPAPPDQPAAPEGYPHHPPQHSAYPAMQAGYPPSAGYGPPPGYAHPQAAPYSYEPQPAPLPPSPPPVGRDDDADDGRTRLAEGFNFKNLRPKQRQLILQIFDGSGDWMDFGPIHATGRNIGRSREIHDHPGLATMAQRHMRLAFEDGQLVVEDLGSLNGVYLRLKGSTELVDGMRFRVGAQVIEFHAPEPFEPMPPLVSEDGEEFCSRDFEPFGSLDLIRPNNRAGIRFPITNPDRTLIGREPTAKLDGHRVGVNLVLANDSTVSSIHAQVRRSDGGYLLEDLNSRNGTFVHVLGSRPVRPGDVLQAGKVLFRIHDPGQVNQGPGVVY